MFFLVFIGVPNVFVLFFIGFENHVFLLVFIGCANVSELLVMVFHGFYWFLQWFDPGHENHCKNR